MTETKQIKFITMQKNWKEPVNEVTDIPINANPKEEIEKILKEYNIEEDRRSKTSSEYKAIYRELVSIEGESGLKKTFCDWKKINPVTVTKNDESYDIMYCEGCKEFNKRHGFGENFWYNRECHPETFCSECNKRFTSKKGLEKHNERDNHKQPEWLPDGV